MVNRNLIRSLEDDSIASELDALFPADIDELVGVYEGEEADAGSYEINQIVEGTIVRVDDDLVLVDVGFKSEGTIPQDEWGEFDDEPVVGGKVFVLIEDMEDDMGTTDDPHGLISLSKKKADSIRVWDKLISKVDEHDVVTGKVMRKIKGGLLVDIGVPVFLPASQVDIRRPGDIGDYIGRVVLCEILKIDQTRRNIVVSRRSLIEREREIIRETLINELEERQIRPGTVKNIADFGAFVDLGGIDGLLHITDMAHTRIGHPSELLSIDQEIEVMILNIDREKQKIALGMKQMLPNPWDNVEEKYPVGTIHKGEVVNVMSYGAFVKLEEGIEGLVHISEMSWTQRVNHPTDLVQIGDEIDVCILNVDRKGEQLSLGMKQTQENPWQKVGEKYPVDSVVEGKVRNLTNYGAFIELEEGIDGLLHVSDLSWTRKISHPNEMLEKGQMVKCRVLAVDQDRRRIALGLKQLDEDPWVTDIPNKYQPGQVVHGKVTKITNFGVFIGLEDGLEGLLHISELADHKVENPEEVVNVGDELEVKILRVDTEERKIGLSRKRVEWNEDQEEEAAAAEGGGAKGDQGPLKGGLGASGPLIQPPTAAAEATDAPVATEAATATETVAATETAEAAPAEAAEEPAEAPAESPAAEEPAADEPAAEGEKDA